MEEAVISLLRELGLNNYEAHVLYALFRLKEADAKRISEAANVPRTKVYEILEELASRGYVVVKDLRPKVYMVRDPRSVLRAMIRERKEMLEKLEKKAQQLGDMLPLLSEVPEEEGNYLLRARDVKDLINILSEELTDAAIVGYTPESSYILSRLGKRMVKSPFDIILDKDRVYIPLRKLGEPSREVVVVVFTQPALVDVFRRWMRGR